VVQKKSYDSEPRAGVVDNPAGDSIETENGEEKTQPVHSIRMRNVRAAIWQNARDDGSVWYATTVSRSYRTNDGSWHTTDSFIGPDLLILAEVSRQAFLWIVAATQGQGRDVPF
jgi:hypothetical protein